MREHNQFIKNRRDINMTKLLRHLALFGALFFNLTVCSADTKLVDELNRQEATWHKGFLFSTILSVQTPEETVQALDWLKKRVIDSDMPDARYALVYSVMLRRTGNPYLRETIYSSAFFGYAALQIDSARCANRNESINIARQWYDAARPIFLSLKEIPADRRSASWMAAKALILSYVARTDADLVKSSAWMCYNLPSYLNQIRALPDVKTETYQGANGKLIVYQSHDTVLPDMATKEVFDQRYTTIINDLEKNILNP